MPAHNAVCKCGYRGMVFFPIKDGIANTPCPECKAVGMEVDWSESGIRQPFKRTWNDKTGMSTMYRANPKNVAIVRKRLAACGLDDAHQIVRDDGSFVTHDRDQKRRLDRATQRCVDQDRIKREKAGIVDTDDGWNI